MHDNWVRKAILHPSGRYIISCGDDKSVRMSDLRKQGREVRTIACSGYVSSVDWNLPQPLLAISTSDNAVILYDCK